VAPPGSTSAATYLARSDAPVVGDRGEGRAAAPAGLRQSARRRVGGLPVGPRAGLWAPRVHRPSVYSTTLCDHLISTM